MPRRPKPAEIVAGAKFFYPQTYGTNIKGMKQKTAHPVTIVSVEGDKVSLIWNHFNHAAWSITRCCLVLRNGIPKGYKT